MMMIVIFFRNEIEYTELNFFFFLAHQVNQALTTRTSPSPSLKDQNQILGERLQHSANTIINQFDKK